MADQLLKLHNAMWPGVVGKGEESGLEPPLGLEEMLDLTAAAKASGVGFDGVDLFLFLPHVDPTDGDDGLHSVAVAAQSRGLEIGSLVAPVWPGTLGDSAMGDAAARAKFLHAVSYACRAAQLFDDCGVRHSGVVRIDSAEFGVEEWRADPAANTKRIAETFREAAKIAADYGQRLAAEGEICWAGMHSWRDMLNLLEEVAMPETLGFQADLAHTYLYLLGYNAPEHALLQSEYNEDEFYKAYEQMVAKLRPWTIDLHIAQNDGGVFGAGSHDKTGKHCPADDPAGKLDIVRCATYWLEGHADRVTQPLVREHAAVPAKMLDAAV
ncbi:MAG: TIM barrel protein, partial [Planctomycetota bacterium]